jgi:pimeloyl-ACP methyl ester carboxylesterase
MLVGPTVGGLVRRFAPRRKGSRVMGDCVGCGEIESAGTSASVDPFNFVLRVTTPVLMLNGRYDHYSPLETAEKPMFMLLRTPNGHKKWLVYDGGHFVPREQLIRETLIWFDRYLGNPK